MSVGAISPLPSPPTPTIELTVDQAVEFREGLHRVELALERMTGRVEGVIDLKNTEHRQFREDIAETNVVLKTLHDRLDEYPSARRVTETVEGFQALRNRMAGALVAGMALGIGGSTAFLRLFGG